MNIIDNKIKEERNDIHSSIYHSKNHLDTKDLAIAYRDGAKWMFDKLSKYTEILMCQLCKEDDWNCPYDCYKRQTFRKMIDNEFFN